MRFLLSVFTLLIASIVSIHGQDVAVTPIIPSPVVVAPLLPIKDPIVVQEEQPEDLSAPTLAAPPVTPAQEDTTSPPAPSPCPSPEHGFISALGEMFTKLGSLIKLGFGFIKSPFVSRQARFQGDSNVEATLKRISGIDSEIRNQFAPRQLLESESDIKASCEPNGTKCNYLGIGGWTHCCTGYCHQEVGKDMGVCAERPYSPA